MQYIRTKSISVLLNFNRDACQNACKVSQTKNIKKIVCFLDIDSTLIDPFEKNKKGEWNRSYVGSGAHCGDLIKAHGRLFGITIWANILQGKHGKPPIFRSTEKGDTAKKVLESIQHLEVVLVTKRTDILRKCTLESLEKVLGYSKLECIDRSFLKDGILFCGNNNKGEYIKWLMKERYNAKNGYCRYVIIDYHIEQLRCFYERENVFIYEMGHSFSCSFSKLKKIVKPLGKWFVFVSCIIGSGGTTVAKLMHESFTRNNLNSKIVRLTKPIKEACAEIVGVSVETSNDYMPSDDSLDELKILPIVNRIYKIATKGFETKGLEKDTQKWNTFDDEYLIEKKLTLTKILKQRLKGVSLGEMQVQVGTEFRFWLGEDIWIKYLMKTIEHEEQTSKNSSSVYIVADGKYKNEINYFLKTQNTITIRLHRDMEDCISLLDGRKSTHKSEEDLNDSTFHFYIDNTSFLKYDLEVQLEKLIECQARTFNDGKNCWKLKSNLVKMESCDYPIWLANAILPKHIRKKTITCNTEERLLKLFKRRSYYKTRFLLSMINLRLNCNCKTWKELYDFLRKFSFEPLNQ